MLKANQVYKSIRDADRCMLKGAVHLIHNVNAARGWSYNGAAFNKAAIVQFARGHQLMAAVKTIKLAVPWECLACIMCVHLYNVPGTKLLAAIISFAANTAGSSWLSSVGLLLFWGGCSGQVPMTVFSFWYVPNLCVHKGSYRRLSSCKCLFSPF